MNKIKRIVSLALVLCMVMAFLPVGVSAAEDASYAYNIVHVDAGRKYFTPGELKAIIDNAAEAGFNQVELYLSDNQGFRFALDDMTLTTDYGTYDLTPALGDGYSDSTGKKPCGTGKYLTQEEMDDIIAYANGKGIDIVPCINVPGHMGAILEEFTGFRYKKYSSTSKSSIDLSNQKAVAFALALTEKYASYFASRGCKFYNVGADEYANDLSSMGFEGMGATLYTKFVQFLNDAAKIITDLGMTPRAFNDGFYYKDYSISIEPDKAYEICYWSSGWGGYDVAAASTIANKGHRMINTHGDYYWVLGNTSWQCSASKAKQFKVNTFQGSTISQPAGAMFCIWCDTGDADTAASVISKTESVIEAFGSVLPQVESLVGGEAAGDVDLTDDATGIMVTAPGLTGLTVSEAVAPAIEGTSKTVAWDMTPETADGLYTGEAEVCVPVPEDFNAERLGAFVVNADGSVTKLAGEYADGFYTYTCPHFSVSGLYEAEPAAEELEERTITMTVGGTATDVILGGDYTDEIDESKLDKNIAFISAKGETVPGESEISLGSQISVSNTNGWSGKGVIKVGNYYMTLNGSTLGVTTDVTEATEFTVTRTGSNQYSITSGRYYVRYSSGVSASTTSYSWSYSSSYGFYRSSYGSRYYLTTNGTTWSAASSSTSSSNRSHLYGLNKTETAPVEQTTVTFYAMKVGVTYVTVGNVRYTINVVAEDLSKVTPLTVEYWVTNNKVTAGGATSKAISAADAHGVGGRLISELIPATGTHGPNNMAYWKTTRLASGSHQTGDPGVDMTMKGNDFTHIRYYGGSWAYSADGRTWTTVVNGDQIVAYYLQATAVTDEVETQVVDWGENYSTSYNISKYILLDYAVKYESGETVPNAFPITNRTLIFHCNDSTDLNKTVFQDGSKYYRRIGMIRAVETAEYEVYMITLTPTSDAGGDLKENNNRNNGTNIAYKQFYKGTEKVVWVDDEANLGAFADESLHYTSISGNYNYTVGGEPVISALEVYNRTGMLVTYYVRAKATEDALTVHYVDDTEDVEFYSYNIAVKEGTYFKENIGLANPWKGNLANGDVSNFYGRTQYVSSDLSTLSQVGAQYLYSEYTCVRVERSADGKHVYLYYTFDPTVSFVIDFSLPLELTATDLSEKLAGVAIEDIAFSGSNYTTYGRLTDNGSSITYQPVKVMQGADYFTLLVTTDRAVDGILDDASNKIAFRVYIVPATTMHYEESFLTLGGFEIEGSANAGKQETELAGTKKQNYGYTAAYTAAGMTNGTEAVSVINGSSANATAEFTFTGDGVEIYVNADKDTGTMLALFHQNKNGSESLTRLYQVDTAAQSGSSAVTGGQDVASYNLPAISINGLDYGTYRIKLMHTGAGHDLGQVRLDGFRVFNTLNDLDAKSYHESEHNPGYVEVRDEVLTALNVTADKIDDEQHYIKTVVSQVLAATDGSLEGALYLTGDQDVDAADLLNNGPKNELFLRKGESVSFDLGNATAQIGLKALNGQVSYTINGVGGSIATSADMFYGSYTGKVTIVNTGDNILSVTKLKLFGGEALQAVSEELVKHALQAMGIIEKPEPVNPFADVAQGSFYYDAVLWAVEKGITTGADDTHFLPEALCQRAAVVTFLWRAAGSPEPETTVNPFVDVTEGSYFYKAVLWALEQGITNGVDERHFAPFGNCSRAQVVTFLWRANGCPKTDAVNIFADVAEGSFYENAVLWALEKGITNGMSSNIFGVDTACNRAQIVTFLYRAK